MADKLEGSAIVANTVSGDRIVTGSITTTQLAPSVANFVNEGKPLKIQTITYPGNDTAANTGGGQTIILSGSGFKQNVQVYINSNAVPSVTYANANAISFTSPALAAATYPVYVINTDDGATAILIPGIQYSGTPTWTTTTPLTTQDASIAWNIQLVATSDSAVSYSLQAGSSLPAGITLAANGLISGTMSSPPADETTYNFTVVANDLENQDASRAFSVTVTVAVLDPYFTYTTLLLHGDGTNNANNHAFVDSSNNAFAITRNGNASQGTFSPFGDNWSNFFDGNGDYLSIADNAALDLGTDDFTIEFWVYPITGIADNAGVVGKRSQSTFSGGDWRISYRTATGKLALAAGGDNNDRSTPVIALNQWSHVAFVRSSGTLSCYANGYRGDSLSWSSINLDNAEALLIGRNVSSFDFSGYISNFRILKGTGLYSGVEYSVPTQPLTSVSNTSILTCQSNAFIDKGPNRFAITRNGDARVSKFDPFKPFKAVPASYGVYFDGTGDYLSIADNTALDMGSSNFTIEGWYFPIGSASSSTAILAKRANSSTVGGVLLYYGGNGLTPSLLVDIGGSWAINQSSSVSFVANQWNHFAIVRNGSAFNLYINGVSGVSATNAGAIPDNASAFTIGAMGADGSGAISPCHISNFRVVKGTAVYTSAFTPPTSPLTAVANTQLLTCQSTTIIDNSTNAFTITRNGDARPTDLNPFTTVFVSEKYNTANGGGSLYSDGTNDGLTFPANTALRPGTSDFTIEFWWYPTNAAAGQYIVHQNYGGGGGGYANFLIYGHTSNSLLYYSATTGSWNVQSGLSMGTYILNSWNHIVVSRTSGTLRTFVNGIPGGSFSDSSNLNDAGNIYLGTYDGTNGTFYGYISGFRMRIGTAAGVTQSSIQVAPPTNVANTAALLNFTNAGILDSVGKNVLETVGDARVNTSVKKFGTGSMYFDGTGDYLKAVATVDNIAYGTGDFTVECWAYFVNAANVQKIFDNYNGNNNPNAALCISNPNANKIQWYSGQTKIVESTSSLSNNTWYHIAVSRTGSTTRLFINGNQEASASDSSSYAIGNGNISIGGEISTGLYSVNGHIDDFRITKGVARYRYNFTPPTKTFNDGDGNLATPTSDVLVGDQVNTPVFPYTTLLLHGDGTNNANNNAFVDSSNNNFAITRNGNATQGTFSPFSPTGWSGYFDGTGDYLTVSNNAVLNPGSNNFTIEAWIYPTNLSSVQCIHYKSESDGTGVLFAINNSGAGKVNFYIGTGGAWGLIFDSPAVISPNIWTHVAVTKNGTTHTIWVNGVSVASTTYAGNPVNTNEDLKIGRFRSANAFEFNGYISNYRFVNGTALYTSAFTPSTSAITAVANTTLLTLQSNRFIDNSTNAFTITRNGDVSVQAFSPFAPSVEYTANTHGGSAYFDGTGDYLTTNATQAIPATGDFTVEAWIYPTISGGNRTIIAQGTSGTAGRLQFNTNTDNTLQLGIGSTIVYSTGTIVANAWNYVAFTRTGSSVAFYINGSAAGTATASGSVQNTTLAIGSEWSGDPYRWLGYIGSVRVSNVLRTINSITTAPFSNDANTVFLANFTNAGILDSTGKNVLETVGDAKVNTATKKYGTGSMYFDGTDDGLRFYEILNTQFGTGDFTVEAWVYITSFSVPQVVVDARGSTTAAAPWQFYVNASNKVVFNYGSNLIGTISVAANTWTHIAATRYGSTLRIFVNGILDSSATTSASLNGVSGQPIYVGRVYDPPGSPYFSGYIDDLRITKGIARYVTNFTPPTAAFLNK